MKPIRLVCATRHTRQQFATQTALGQSLSIFRYTTPPELLLYDSNTHGLPRIYNTAIEYSREHPAILVFIHDDVWLNDLFWVERIYDAARHFDIAGLAGNRRRLPGQPAWAFPKSDFRWDEPQYLSGTVGHGKGFPCNVVTYYGPSAVECKLLDGVMLIADSDKLNERSVRFDERFDFHFYDMDFCRQAELHGLRMGTWPIGITHESGGAFGSSGWRSNYQKYLEKYGERITL